MVCVREKKQRDKKWRDEGLAVCGGKKKNKESEEYGKNPHFHFFVFSTENEKNIVFIFWLVWENIFSENIFKNSTKRIFIPIFCFQ